MRTLARQWRALAPGQRLQHQQQAIINSTTRAARVSATVQPLVGTPLQRGWRNKMILGQGGNGVASLYVLPDQYNNVRDVSTPSPRCCMWKPELTTATCSGWYPRTELSPMRLGCIGMYVAIHPDTYHNSEAIAMILITKVTTASGWTLRRTARSLR